ncbi:MAG TPA: hypothetical protein VJZ04_07885 [Lachnospiraceae bacterium]|nr:hypothetical protein [Lachnospiraceae bacterium]
MNKSMKLHISVNGHYLRVGILFIIYLILVLGSKGYFDVDDSVESVRDGIIKLIKHFVIGIPMFIINILPVLVSGGIIVLSALNKPVKKLFLSTMILIVVYHIFYFILSIGSFTLSWQFLSSTILFIVLFFYFILGSEAKAKARKPIFEFEFDFKLSKYNMSVAGVMIVLLVMTVVSPMVVIGDGAEFALLGLGEAASLNETVGSVSKILEDLLVALMNFTKKLLKNQPFI